MFHDIDSSIKGLLDSNSIQPQPHTHTFTCGIYIYMLYIYVYKQTSITQHGLVTIESARWLCCSCSATTLYQRYWSRSVHGDQTIIPSDTSDQPIMNPRIIATANSSDHCRSSHEGIIGSADYRNSRSGSSGSYRIFTWNQRITKSGDQADQLELAA